MVVSGDRLAEIVARYDTSLKDAEDGTLDRVNSALESAYRQLEKELLRAYGKNAGTAGLLPNQKRLLILQEISSYLELLNPKTREEIEAEFNNLLRGSYDSGLKLSDELASAIANERLRTVSGVPLEAIKFQAQDASKRLYRWTEEMQGKISGIVEMHLAMGSGNQKVATALRRELGIVKGRAEAIARTESISATDSAARANYKRNDIDFIQRIATQDSRTCVYCAARAGRVYRTDEAPAAIHVNDRCYNMPWKQEWADAGLIDTAWIEQHAEAVANEVQQRGETLNNGLAPFEKANGLTKPPEAVWKPGQPIAPPAPLPAAKFPASIEGLKQVRSLGGSTGAVLVEDPATGKQYVLKRGSSAEHLQEEYTADQAYRALGVAVPDAKLYTDADGKPVKLAEYIEGRSLSSLLSSGDQAEINRVKRELQKNFAADALLGNWDVIGLDSDNILIAKDGTPYRIDNGGSLRYRAQGQPKGDRWNQYPIELYSLRDADINEQTAAIFSGLGHFNIVSQIEGLADRRSTLLKALPDELKGTVGDRLTEMERQARLSRTLEADKWREGYIGEFSRHSLGLRASGLIGRLPDELRHTGGVEVEDVNGKPFDNLRGQDSHMLALRDYVSRNGGSYLYLSRWMAGQAGSSWSEESRAFKWFLSEQRTASRDSYFWLKGEDSAKDAYESLGKDQERFKESFTAWHAFNYEFLDRVQFKHNDRASQTIQLMRTENESVMQINNLNVGDRNVTMRRGAAESCSIYESVEVYGSEMTVQQVPYHRVLGVYFYERNPGKGGTAFMGDDENEFVCLLDDIPFDYTKSL